MAPQAASVLLTLLSSLTAVAAQSFIQGYSAEAYLTQWALQSFTNLPPYYWNNIFDKTRGGGDPAPLGLQAAGAVVVDGAFAACPDGSIRGYQGITCDAANQVVTGVDLSFASLPPGSPRVKGSLYSPAWQPAIVTLPNVTSLNVAGNLLTGPLPAELGLAPALKRLNLAQNRFQGPVPESLCNLHLSCINLSGNRFTGSIPKCLQSFPCIDFEGNPLSRRANDCDATTNVSSCDRVTLALAAPPPPPAAPSSALSVGAIVGIVIAGLVAAAAGLAGWVLLSRHLQKKRREAEQRQRASDVETQISTRHFGSMTRFSEEELAKACDDFDGDCILGEGGFAVVYKGRLEQGLEVAIKRIKAEKMKDGSELEFLNEVEIISRAAHKNLVQCLGFCVEPGRCLMLVLHYYRNGSVASRTAGKEGNPLSWEDRLRVAKGAADGVAYLHNDCNPKLIHRDIKAENVLLNEADEAAVADFGLAAELDVDVTHRETQVKGTIGHIAPEYILSGHCSEKTDVYAFGSFLLELVAGKSLQELAAHAEAKDLIFYDWVSLCLENDDVALLLDPELGDWAGSALRDGVLGLLRLALRCLETDPKARPDMNEVALLLVPRGMQEQMGRWREGVLSSAPGQEDVDLLQWELDHADLGDDTLGSSTLDSAYFASSTTNSTGPLPRNND